MQTLIQGLIKQLQPGDYLETSIILRNNIIHIHAHTLSLEIENENKYRDMTDTMIP